MKRRVALQVAAAVAFWLLGGSAFADPKSWDGPPPDEQLELDPTLIPPGKGALFVPAFSDPQAEPTLLVRRGGDTVATGTSGQKIFVEPGEYDVFIGSGAPRDRLKRLAKVREGRTTLLPVDWSGLIVNVTDDRSVPFRGSYELVALPERKNLGLGLGADIERGEGLRTWVLESGLYLLIRTGESYQARRDFFTVRLRPGYLERVTLVMDREDGAFRGAGEVSLAETTTALSNWHLHLLLGGDFELTHRGEHVVGQTPGLGLAFAGYIDFILRYMPQRHLWYLRSLTEAGYAMQPKQPFQKSLDRLKLDTLYVFRLLPWLGPYAQAGVETPMFPGYRHFDEPTRVNRSDRVGPEGKAAPVAQAATKFRLSRPFAPLDLRGGMGLRLELPNLTWLELTMRLGIGGRLVFTQGLWVAKDLGATPAFEVTRKGDFRQVGFEGTLIAAVQPTRWLTLNTEFDILEPFNDWTHPVLDLENTVGLRLVSFASLNYVLRLVQDRQISPEPQLDQRVLLRFSWKAL